MCAGAEAINGKVLSRIEVHGKNLFYFFGEGPEAAVMHIHFGMSGRFRVSPLPAPEFTPTTRLQLLNEELGVAAHLSAMTVQHGDLGERLWSTLHTGGSDKQINVSYKSVASD